MTNKTYSELIKIPTFKGRFQYLNLHGEVGFETFGFDRYLNQAFYKSNEWRRFRNSVIIRDNCCDLGVEGYDILNSKVIIHHINPITAEDIINRTDKLFSLENVICVTENTHRAIHYGDERIFLNEKTLTIRRPNDTCPWRL